MFVQQVRSLNIRVGRIKKKFSMTSIIKTIIQVTDIL